MKIAFFGYRNWAKEIKLALQYEDYEFVSLEKADVVLYYGWSEYIPAEIYEKKLCLILHTSLLPKYRGGSPLQHQIMNGEKTSAVTILKVEKEIDTGDIYSQTRFSLKGTLDDILIRIMDIGIKDTIKVLKMIEKGIKPKKQKGKPTVFKRRKPEESRMLNLHEWKSKDVYNFIRALSSSYEDYPNAYIVCADGKKLYFKEVDYER